MKGSEIMINNNNLPIEKGEKKTILFDEIFYSYQKINIGMLLIHSYSDKSKLTKCPDSYKPEYIIDNIEIRKQLFTRKKRLKIND